MTMVRELASRIAAEENKDLVIIDGSPGIGCPVIASITGTDLALVMTEPSISGGPRPGEDPRRRRALRGQALVAVNKHDLNPEMTEEIGGLCGDLGVELAGSASLRPRGGGGHDPRETLVEVEGPSGKPSGIYGGRSGARL